MSEADLWRAMDKGIGHLGHFSRVESHEQSAGIPDVDYCILGVENHVELKYGKEKRPKIRPTQVKWFRDRVKAGGHPYLFTQIHCPRSADYWMLHQGDKVGFLARESNLKFWVRDALEIWTKEMVWLDLYEFLQLKWNES